MTDATDELWNLAQQHLRQGRPEQGRDVLEALLRQQPGHARALLILGRIAQSQGRIREAVTNTLAAAEQLQADAGVVCDIAETLLRLGETVVARGCLERLLPDAGSDGALLARMGGLYRMLSEHAKALDLLQRAVAAGAGLPEVRLELALQLAFHDQSEQAGIELAAALRMRPTFGRAALDRARLRRQTPQENHLGDLRRRLAVAIQNSEDHARFEFALYKELEDCGDYEQAWQALARGNRVLYSRQRHDPAFADRLFDELQRCCTPVRLQAETVTHAGPQPIFIIGMPRSGTTLLERILGNHSQVKSAGELEDFGLQLRWSTDHGTTLDSAVLQRLDTLDFAGLGRRYLSQTQWRAQGRRYFVDKLPRNWMVAGLIHRALPQARILHLVRDPMDVCFSNFRALLGVGFAWSYDQRALAAHYRQYRRVMAHWHAAMPGAIFDVDYAVLVRAPEATTRAVLAHCGLDWEPDCLDLSRNQSTVATLSRTQVRQSIDTRYFDEWRRYEAQLQPLREALEA